MSDTDKLEISESLAESLGEDSSLGDERGEDELEELVSSSCCCCCCCCGYCETAELTVERVESEVRFVEGRVGMGFFCCIVRGRAREEVGLEEDGLEVEVDVEVDVEGEGEDEDEDADVDEAEGEEGLSLGRAEGLINIADL